MDILGRLLSGGALRAGNPGPLDDFWYSDPGGIVASAGQRVTSETAQRVSAWYRGRDLLATCLAMLPCKVYRRLANDGGAAPATEMPLYDLLHDQPNDWQDSFQWRREKMFHLIDFGWTYDWLVAGPRGFVHQLQPIHPSLVTPEQIKQGPGKGRYLFHVRDEQTGQVTVATQDEIFYLRGAGGKGILEYARASLGTAMATGSYASQIFNSGMLNGGIIEVPGVLDKGPAQRLALSMVTKPGEWHIPKVLEQGAKWAKNDQAMTPEDAQMLLSQKFSVDEMARWLGVPRQMLENSDPSFGNAEQFDQNFITYSMGGWLSLFEFGVNAQLILQPKTYYAEFTRDSFVRGKFLDRAQGNVAYVNAGIVTADEVRGTEGLNKRGGKADELRDPQNITGKPAASLPPSTTMKGDANARAEAIVTAEAARLLTTEVNFIQRAAVKHAADADKFAAAVAQFYADHLPHVSQKLLMTYEQAESYCAGQASQILSGDWVAALATWQSRHYASGLAALALEES